MDRLSKTVKVLMDHIKIQYRKYCKHGEVQNLGEPMFSNKGVCARCGVMVDEKETHTDQDKEGRSAKKEDGYPAW